MSGSYRKALMKRNCLSQTFGRGVIKRDVASKGRDLERAFRRKVMARGSMGVP
jgi:hypothetical protein